MRRFFCVLLLLPLFCFGRQAAAEGAVEKEVLQQGLDGETLSISGEPELDGSYDVDAALSRLWEQVKSRTVQRFRQDLGYGLKLVALAMFCSLLCALSPEQRMEYWVNLIGCSAAALLLAGDVDSVIQQSMDVILQLSDYAKAALPAVFTAAAACGAVGASAIKYAAASFALDVLIHYAIALVLPMIWLFVCVSVSRSLFDHPILGTIASFLKFGATTLMTGACLLFSVYLSITGLIAGSADAVAVKTAKTVIAHGLPVVGKLLSDSSSLVLAAANLVKNSAGVYCLVAVCALCVLPFVDLFIKMLMFRAAAAASEMLPGAKLSRLIRDLSTAFALLLGLLGSCSVMLFVAIVSGIKVLV